MKLKQLKKFVLKLTAILNECPVDVKVVDDIFGTTRLAEWNKDDNGKQKSLPAILQRFSKAWDLFLWKRLDLVIFAEKEYHEETLQDEPKRDTPKNDPKTALRQCFLSIEKMKGGEGG